MDGRFVKGPVSASYEIQDGLRLKEVHLSIQIGPFGELSLFSLPGPRLQTSL